MVRLDLDRIRGAVAAIDPVFLNTPQYECAALGDALGCSMTLKVETLNPVRSFKGRGTETVMASLARRGNGTAAVCASAGNLGQALGVQRGATRDPGDRCCVTDRQHDEGRAHEGPGRDGPDRG